VWDALAIRDPEAPIVTNRRGEPEPDPELRDQENVPLPTAAVGFESDIADRLATIEYRTAIDEYVDNEVLPYIPDAWVDHSKTRIGYEVLVTRQFYRSAPPRSLSEIDMEIRTLETTIQELLREVTK
jgi:type I restriction enzyme M protein